MRAMCVFCLLPPLVGVFYVEAKTEDEVERILQSVSNGKNRETRGWNRFWAEKSELGEWNANFRGKFVKTTILQAIWFLSSAPITLILPLILLFFDDRLLRRAVDNVRITLRYFYSPPYIPLCSSSAPHSNSSSFIVDTA